MQSLPRALASLFVVAAVTGAASSACSTSSNDDDPLTFSQTIEPLVQEKCQVCHHAGGIAPFPLVSYEDVRRVGALAKEKVAARQMPPWGAFDDAKCKMRVPFKDDLRLSDEQVDEFVRWVDKGMPLGDESKRPPPRTFPPTGLPNKTNTFAMAKPHEVPGGVPDDIRCFPIDPGFAQDTWVGATNVVPGDPTVVHHVIVFVDEAGESMAKAGPDGSYQCFGGPGLTQGIPSLLAVWAPGVPPAAYGEDIGLKVPKGSKLVMQVHYHPTAETKTDRTSLELQTLPYKPGYVAQVLLAGNATNPNGKTQKLLPGPDDPPSGPVFVIPANSKGHTESMELDVPTKVGQFDIPAVNVMAVGSHMHWAGVDMKIEIERHTPVPDQPDQECLLGTPKYDFNWQRGYTYDEPMDKLPVVSPGDTIKLTCTYDNTTDNPNIRRMMSEMHLAAPTDIHLGESTVDEMCLGVFVIVRSATLLD